MKKYTLDEQALCLICLLRVVVLDAFEYAPDLKKRAHYYTLERRVLTHYPSYRPWIFTDGAESDQILLKYLTDFGTTRSLARLFKRMQAVKPYKQVKIAQLECSPQALRHVNSIVHKAWMALMQKTRNTPTPQRSSKVVVPFSRPTPMPPGQQA
ncbi:hypothetical protein [Leptolyngbya sp. FACHB-261]|uniref:hypothetical protein n=1 Tax=Leptolyngbya sp. FACHB-261 TaxID=2692806 RepID=UPI0016897F0E|nr:hypothetical protein [Leptolyngbya sp. FACHB-261]MBD2101567.1 hypothetical protein [Leptolyngbya sp. FACHB-261]